MIIVMMTTMMRRVKDRRQELRRRLATGVHGGHPQARPGDARLKVALPGASLRTLHTLANASGITARPRAAEGRLPMRPV